MLARIRRIIAAQSDSPDRREVLKGMSAVTLAGAGLLKPAYGSSGTSSKKSLPPAEASTTTEAGNVQVINRSGVHWARVDNTGTRDVGAEINALIEAHWNEDGLDLFLAPGTYLIGTPIVVAHSNISIQGYTYGFAYPRRTKSKADAYRGWEGKTRLLVAPLCRDAIQIGPTWGLAGFVLRNITIAGQNGRTGTVPNINPEQNGIRIMPDTRPASCVVDYCQFIHLTHGILNEHPESTMDVWYVTDNWIAECNSAIKLHASLFASVISRNGFHDMSGTVLELRGTNNVDLATKEMVISDNTGWNPGKLVFDIEGFRGGTINDNAFMFNHHEVQSFARLRSVHMTHVSGNTFVVDGSGPAGWNEELGGKAAQGYVQDGERYDTLTMAGCSDCTVSGNSLISFNRERPVILLGADAVTGKKSRHNHIIFNKVLPSAGFESRPQVEFTDGAEANLVVLPMAAGARTQSAVLDHGTGNEICALPPAGRKTSE